MGRMVAPLLPLLSPCLRPPPPRHLRPPPPRHLASTPDPGVHCRELVKRADHEHYLASLLLPPGLRTAALAARALSCEVAAVRDSVSDKTLGLVRAQWWKDAVEAMYQEGAAVPPHPVVLEVAAVVARHSPSPSLLHDLAASRDAFLSDRPFDTLEEVEEYGVRAFAGVYHLLLEVQGNTCGHARHAATQLGKCEGLVTLLRGTPYNVSKRRLYLPRQLLVEQGVREEGVLRRGPLEEGVRDVVEVVAGRAQGHLEAARLRGKFLGREQRAILLPAVAADHYLAALAGAGCNLWDKALHVRNSKLPLSLAWYKLKSTY